MLQNKWGEMGPCCATYCIDTPNCISCPREFIRRVRHVRHGKVLLAWEGESPWRTMDCPICGLHPQLPTSAEQPSEISVTFMGIFDKGSGNETAGQLWSWNKTEECPQFCCIKVLWKKMPKEWGIKIPVIIKIPKWRMPLSSLLLPWALLSYY